MAAQDGGKQLLFPNPPFLRILRAPKRALQSAPQPLPGLTTFINPHGGVGVLPCALHALREMMGRETWQLEHAARLGTPERRPDSLCAASPSHITFMDADHPHQSSS